MFDTGLVYVSARLETHIPNTSWFFGARLTQNPRRSPLPHNAGHGFLLGPDSDLPGEGYGARRR